MKIKDYIFYRMYINYTKAKDDGIFSTIIFFTIIEYFITSPIPVFITELVDLKGSWSLIPMSIPMLIIFILNYKRYYKKGRVVEIIKRYKNSKYNTIIKNWMIHSLIFFAIAFGFMAIGLTIKYIPFL